MTDLQYDQLTQLGLAQEPLSQELCKQILEGHGVDTFKLIHAAYLVREAHFGKEVMVHTLNNAQNGYCPEDCSYCAQAKTSTADIEKYAMKSKKEIMDEARRAYENGSFRYCMVFAGRGPTEKRLDQLCDVIGDIKSEHPNLQLCLSAGLVDDDGAQRLKEAGLDRLNHNLNTSEKRYASICTTHTYQDRVNTLKSAKKAGLGTCSGLIVGMGESEDEIIELAFKLRELEVPSIPVNYYLSIPGTDLNKRNMDRLSPAYCLRVLCLFRFLNPKAELRVAAGRETHFGALQPFIYYVANSIFVDGYLNAKGSDLEQTYTLLRDAGFSIKSNFNIEDVLNQQDSTVAPSIQKEGIKSVEDLRPCVS